MSDQKDLFGNGDAAAAEKKVKPKEAPPAASGGGNGGLPPHFAPISGEFRDSPPLGKYASTQYLQYAVANVKNRALPRLGGGQKPGQGRILYSMVTPKTPAGAK